ncbi:hypothetical protein [Parasitella parasitica]|uniref:Nucleoside diphosphate kinase n=1 Tax=Parasitella parasitica TaxID=35722 RepID=A0A0B7NJZ9_9FUNG|nr:hypothetical protein [Parasitella parasitica]
MPEYFKLSLFLILFYGPFIFFLLIPNNSFFAHLTIKEVKYEICSRLPSGFAQYKNVFGCKPPSMTVAIIKPDGMPHQREILSQIQRFGFNIKYDLTLNASTDQIKEWYFDKQDASYYPELERYLTRSEIRVLQLWRIEAVPCLRQLIGPTDSTTARQLFPKSLRALYGTDIQENAIHASDSEESAEREFAIFFQQEAAAVNTRRFD